MLIETKLIGGRSYHGCTEFKELIKEAELENTFEDVWDTPLDEFELGEDGPLEDEVITRTVEQAEDEYHLTTHIEDNKLYFKLYEVNR